MKKLLCMLLVLATILTCVPMLASAESSVPYVAPVPETVTTTETIMTPVEVTPGWYTVKESTVTRQYQLPLDTVKKKAPEKLSAADIEESGSGFYFDTFEDLQELAKKDLTGYNYVYFQYNGTEDLVISADLTLPSIVQLYVYDANVIVNKGVTFRSGEWLYAKGFHVKGTAYTTYLEVLENLTVSGKLYAEYDIYLEDGATVTGESKIVFSGSYNQLVYRVVVDTMNELTNAVAAAKANTSERAAYQLYLAGAFVISKNVNIPANCDLLAQWQTESVTVKAGCTLTVNNYFSISAPVTVRGTLKNNGQVSISAYGIDNKLLTFAGDGKYSGSGRIYIHDDVLGEVEEYISGLNLSNFEITKRQEYSTYWELRNLAGLTKLNAPTNLSWGTYYNLWTYNASTGKYEQKDAKMPGVASFKVNAAKAYMTNVRFYNAADDSNVFGGTSAFGWWWEGSSDATAILSQDWLVRSDIESGTYYFTVTNEGDYVNTRNSNATKSKTWTYTKPSSKVGKPTNLTWVGTNATFKAPSATTYVGGYEIEVYYSATKDGTPQQFGSMWSYDGSAMTQMNLQWAVEELGAGYYSFRVRSLSSNINKRANGAWTAMSKAANLKPMDLKVTNRASDGKPSLSWNKIPGAAKYQIYRATKQDGNYSLMKTVTGTSCVNANAKAGTNYFYQVVAVNANGETMQYSDTVSIRCDLARPDVTATNVAASGKIKLTWKKIEGAEKYEVYRSTSQNGTYTKLGSTTKLTYTNTSAVAGKKYFYKVKAIHSNSDANSAFSQVDSLVCDLKKPTISIKLNDAGKPRISWTKIDGATKYQVYRSETKNGTYKLLGTTKNAYFVNKNAEAGVTYYFKIRAVHSNTNANSAFSAIKSITAG